MHAAADLGRVAVLAAALSTGGIVSGEPVGRQDKSAPPESNDGQHSMHEEFDEAIGNVFPMTPDMVRRFRRIHDGNEVAAREVPFPEPLVDAVFVELAPGERPTELRVAPGIASAIGFFDASGRPWPIRQFVIGNGDGFKVIQLGEGSLSVSPLERVGWTNLIVALLDEPVPVVLRVVIDRGRAHFSRSVRILKPGPNPPTVAAGTGSQLTGAGNREMMAVLSGLDLPEGAEEVAVTGADATAWLVGEDLYLRTGHPLLSPAWTGALAGPDRVRAYRLKPVSSLLLSVDGRIVLAEVALP